MQKKSESVMKMSKLCYRPGNPDGYHKNKKHRIQERRKMLTAIRDNLEGNWGNHIMPFLWLRGEEEAVLRKYMGVIHASGIGAVCVESRPHPDFCGEKWWHDLNVILEEAEKRGMKVWILDDSHFPTGYANGALKEAPEELCRQGICYAGKTVTGKSAVINIEKFLKRKNDRFSLFALADASGREKRVFSGDTLLSVTAIRLDGDEVIDLTDEVREGKIKWKAPGGRWKIGMCKLSRNCGAHRDYINMLDEKSCRVLLDSVYEPHYRHYKDKFGSTIAGFFSDEPELGNGALYANKPLGEDQDLPWSSTLILQLEKAIGSSWKNALPYLWENGLDKGKTARIRFAYMDAVTRTVSQTFSKQIGSWCRGHGVEYIGHVVEDNNNHARTGASLGHYFRGLAGQDMAGIDDIGGQVMPQGEDKPDRFMKFMKRDGEFYHYVLGKLGPSLAAVDAGKQGRTMCEIFGNYGWAEGLRLERYLADHFMACGVNYFVPHAFSAKEFPDPDCPPHFYAQGHNPQYKHFKSLMDYMNRVCSLINGGSHVAPVALLYHGEAEWTGKAMMMQKAARALSDCQINFDIVPTDVFRDRAEYRTDLAHGFRVNTQEYRALVIPYAEFISKKLAEAIWELTQQGITVAFLDKLPDGFYDGGDFNHEIFAGCKIFSLEELAEGIHETAEIRLEPADNRIRYLHYRKEKDIFYFINEGTQVYEGIAEIPAAGGAYAYDAWNNRLETVEKTQEGDKSYVTVHLEPFHSLLIVFDESGGQKLYEPLYLMERSTAPYRTDAAWERSYCTSKEYPAFGKSEKVMLPDKMEKENPHFSGWICYRKTIRLRKAERTAVVVRGACESAEVFVNGVSAGVQVTPVSRFDITGLVKEGENEIRIEVASTLERERAFAKNRTQTEKLMQNKILAPLGIKGGVEIYEE